MFGEGASAVTSQEEVDRLRKRRQEMIDNYEPAVEENDLTAQINFINCGVEFWKPRFRTNLDIVQGLQVSVGKDICR